MASSAAASIDLTDEAAEAHGELFESENDEASQNDGADQVRDMLEALSVTRGPAIDQQRDLKEEQQEMSETSTFMKLFRVVMAFLVFWAILLSALASKVSFFVVVFRFQNAVNKTGTQQTKAWSQDQEKGEAFATIFIFLVVPHLFVLLWSLWSGVIGKKSDNYPWPRPMAILWAVVAGVLESIGIVLFVLEVCVDLPIPIAIAVSNGALFFSLLVPFKSFSLSYLGEEERQDPPLAEELKSDAAVELRNSKLKRAIWILCTLGQVAALVAIPILIVQENSGKGALVGHGTWRLICLPLSLVFLSVSWSGFVQHRVNNCVFKPAISPFRTARWKAGVITSFVKLVATIVLFLIFDEVFHYKAVHHMTAGFQLIHGDADMTTAILVHIGGGLLAYVLICAACAMTLHRWSMVLPLLALTPLSIAVSALLCDGSSFGMGEIGHGPWHGYNFCTHDHVLTRNAAAFVVACALWGTQVVYAFIFILPVTIIPLSREESMFHSPGYNPIFLDQFVFLNWRADHLTPPKYRRKLHGESRSPSPTASEARTMRKRKVFICSTMYHEADYEQENLLKSIRHVHDAVRDNTAYHHNLEFESHIFFDGAVRHRSFNEFVLQLFSLVESVLGFDVSNVEMYETPYGMQANWNMRAAGQGAGDSDVPSVEGMRFTVHLKDGHKYKNKKRWSQVMYMSYVLDYCCSKAGGDKLEDTFILTTDADIVFSYSSVKALLDLMARDDHVGAVCARTHPAGSGPVVWYQVFDYAIGHWFQKPAEHVIGSVMCCPGCFSVFRCKALKEVIHVYATKVEQAMEFLTKDMGEDRWLCTLLVERGWQLVYCAASENHTFCPDTFEEFFKQRRRWIPSTLANLGLCVQQSKKIVKNNDSVGWWFILYQALMIFSTIIAPGTIILLVSSGLVYAYGFNDMATLITICIVTVGFGYICIAQKKYEMAAAKILTFIFAILMVAVFVGVIRQIVLDADAEHCNFACMLASNASYDPLSTCDRGYQLVAMNCTTDSFLGSPIGVTTIYLATLTSMFLIAGLTHPSEFFCLAHGVWYLLCLPSGYIFLFVYSLCNMDSQSWGTREGKKTSTGGDEGKNRSWQEAIRMRLDWLRETFSSSNNLPPYQQMRFAPYGYAPVPQNVPTSVQPNVQNSIQRQLTTTKSPHHQEESRGEASSAYASHSERPTDESEFPQLHPASTEVAFEAEVESASPQKVPPPGYPEPRDVVFGDRVVNLLAKEEPGAQVFAEHDLLPQQEGSVDPRSRAGSGAAALGLQGPDHQAADRPPPDQADHPDKNLPCNMIDRTDIESILKRHQLEHLAPRFIDNGFGDAMFLVGMNKEEMKELGVELSVSRGHLSRDIKALPPVPFENGVPARIFDWLTLIGLPQYRRNFLDRGYISRTGNDNIEGLKELTREKLVGELGIYKKGHLKHMMTAIKFIRYPTERELKIREVRKKIFSRAHPRLDKVEEKKSEQVFWEALSAACMKPETTVLGTNLELAEKLVELRNGSVMTVCIANVLWLVIIQTLARLPELNIAGTNPIGLIFLLVYGTVYITQFISMLVHRLINAMHLLAAAKEAAETDRRRQPIDIPQIPTRHEMEAEGVTPNNPTVEEGGGYTSTGSYQGYDSDDSHRHPHRAGQRDGDVSEGTALLPVGGNNSRSRRC